MNQGDRIINQDDKSGLWNQNSKKGAQVH